MPVTIFPAGPPRMPQPTAATKVLWRLNETLADLNANIVGIDKFYSPFRNAVNPGVNDLTFKDTDFAAAVSQVYKIGAPGAFQSRGVDFYQGTQTQQRDYLFGANLYEPQTFTLSMLVHPWFGLGAASNLIEKVWNPAGWVAPKFVSVQIFQTAAANGEWGITLTNAGGSTNQLVGNGNTFEHLRLRPNDWNHIGFSYDGANARIYINGLEGPVLAKAGPIDYGTHGDWVIGSNELIGGAGLDTPNARFQLVRFDELVQPLSFFEQCYEALLGLQRSAGI